MQTVRNGNSRLRDVGPCRQTRQHFDRRRYIILITQAPRRKGSLDSVYARRKSFHTIAGRLCAKLEFPEISFGEMGYFRDFVEADHRGEAFHRMRAAEQLVEQWLVDRS